jgi:hypothetical protein
VAACDTQRQVARYKASPQVQETLASLYGTPACQRLPRAATNTASGAPTQAAIG